MASRRAPLRPTASPSRWRCPRLALLPGKYFVRAFAADPEGLRVFDTREVPLVVTGESREMGFVRLPHQWQ